MARKRDLDRSRAALPLEGYVEVGVEPDEEAPHVARDPVERRLGVRFQPQGEARGGDGGAGKERSEGRGKGRRGP